MTWEDLEMVTEWVVVDQVILSLMYQIYLVALEEEDKEVEDLDTKVSVDLVIKVLILISFKCFLDLDPVTTSISVREINQVKRNQEVGLEEVEIFSDRKSVV